MIWIAFSAYFMPALPFSAQTFFQLVGISLLDGFSVFPVGPRAFPIHIKVAGVVVDGFDV